MSCVERKERSVGSNFSDQVLPCFSGDARPRNNMLVGRLSCLFLLQSVHSTEFCPGTTGNLNDKLITFVHPCDISIMVLLSSGFAVGPEQNLEQLDFFAGVLSSLWFQQISERALFDPNENCSTHCSAVTFETVRKPSPNLLFA